MKKMFAILIASLIFSVTSAMADVTYLNLQTFKGYNHGISHDVAGEEGAKALNKWSKENPDKRIVSIAPNHRSHGGGMSDTELCGFWIVWEEKSAK